MKIELAKTAGFCFGVKKAVDTAYRLAQEPMDPQNPVYMLGELIHNKTVTGELAGLGLLSAETLDDIPEGARVLIRAHGVPPQILADLEAKQCEVIDSTCPYVQKIHRLAKTASQENRQVLIAGNPGHPEVVGIMGECCPPAVLLHNQEDAVALASDDRSYTLV
ncbi:MAG: bifunctional 4-hydroxy-3-methylbut-2-enyl diphosphate reductase/30S ribosomal protein S1, partial [Clostridia bacterium]|nr:bifunctional 4-hydroxy-3-methylbut-2-enyl diphosphate reductase/30S ribosomal protein S1 [Clostridia bacterium]